MMHPLVPGFILTPICPHSLSFRPVVLPDSVTLKLTIAACMCIAAFVATATSTSTSLTLSWHMAASRGSAWVSFDGRGREELKQGDSLVIEGSLWPFPSTRDEAAAGKQLVSSRYSTSKYSSIFDRRVGVYVGSSWQQSHIETTRASGSKRWASACSGTCESSRRA